MTNIEMTAAKALATYLPRIAEALEKIATGFESAAKAVAIDAEVDNGKDGGAGEGEDAVTPADFVYEPELGIEEEAADRNI